MVDTTMVRHLGPTACPATSMAIQCPSEVLQAPFLQCPAKNEEVHRQVQVRTETVHHLREVAMAPEEEAAIHREVEADTGREDRLLLKDTADVVVMVDQEEAATLRRDLLVVQTAL